MQMFLRTLIVILLVVVAAAIVYTQSQLYVPPAAHFATLTEKPIRSQVPEASVPSAPPSSVTAAINPLASTPSLGTETLPVAVKIVNTPPTAEEKAEREKDREIQRNIEHYTAKLAATSLAHNFLLLFQAIIYFLILVIIFLLLESVKKFADAAAKSAEAARKSAELAETIMRKLDEKPSARRVPPNLSRKR